MWPRTHLYLWLRKMWNQNKESGKFVGNVMRNTNNVYILENENQSYLNMLDESWLWHRKLGHLSFDNVYTHNLEELQFLVNLLQVPSCLFWKDSQSLNVPTFCAITNFHIPYLSNIGFHFPKCIHCLYFS